MTVFDLEKYKSSFKNENTFKEFVALLQVSNNTVLIHGEKVIGVILSATDVQNCLLGQISKNLNNG